jgi:hypothetical protein
MISLISSRLPSQANNKASDCRKPVSTSSPRKFLRHLFFEFATHPPQSNLCWSDWNVSAALKNAVVVTFVPPTAQDARVGRAATTSARARR